MNLASTLRNAPVHPLCFTSKEQWVDYLLASQHSKHKPFVYGKFQKSFNFCTDCTLEHSARMAYDGKCNPSVFRGAVTQGDQLERV